MNSILYNCKNIHKSYRQPVKDLEVIKNLDLILDKGSTLSLVGPSGCGKTTLLNILAGLDFATSGEVSFLGKDMSLLDSDARANLRNKEIGFVYQFHHLLPELSSQENVALPMLMSGLDKQKSMKRALELMKKVYLSDKLSNRPGELSGGERQRVAIARSLSNNPSCLLMDEPTGNLDTSNADIITNLLLELVKEEGVSLIVATHDLSLASRLDETLNLESS
ncbi:ABC transporter ATP-binding protein [Gammaproteobacteria bacterium]|nr:ABC transporter ATP-binding protein [Gammaproteobacteria bacterium]